MPVNKMEWPAMVAGAQVIWEISSRQEKPGERGNEDYIESEWKLTESGRVGEGDQNLFGKAKPGTRKRALRV